MKRLSIIPLAVLAFAPLTRVTAQEPPPVKVGDRVRVTAPGLGVPSRDGTLRLLDADSLVMRPNGGRSRLVIPLASVTRFEVHRGRKSRAPIGALVGALALGAYGFAIGDDSGLDCAEGPCIGRGPVAATGAVAGLLLGAVIGALIKTDRWEEVPLDQLRVTFVPQRDGRFAFGLSLRF